MTENLSISPEQFDITPKSTIIKIGNDDYRVKEVTAGVARRYRQSMLEGAAMSDTQDGGKEFRLGTGLANTEITLVSGCLYKIVKDTDGRVIREESVSESTICNWPDREVLRIAKIAKDLSPSLSDTKENPNAAEELGKN